MSASRNGDVGAAQFHSVPLVHRSADGLRLQGRRWHPEGAVRAEILLVHGLSEHLGRYEHVGRVLASRGFRVSGIDLRGHGDSAGRRGHVRRWRDYQLDLLVLSRELGFYFVLAHSMGALVALDFLRTDRGARGLVLTSPLLAPAVRVPVWKVWAGRLLAPFVPVLALRNEVDPEWLSRDPEVVRAYREDPKVLRAVTVGWFAEMERAIRRVTPLAPEYRLPLQVHLAAEDRLVDNGAAEAFAARWGGPHAERRWSGCRHELLNELVWEDVVREIAAWIDAQL